MKYLLDNGAEANMLDVDNISPLSLACEFGNLEAAKLLLEYGADANEDDFNGITPLYLASEKGYFDLVQLLLDGDYDVKIDLEISPIHAATERGHTQIVEKLIEKGAEFELNELLDISIENNQKDTFSFLIKHDLNNWIQSTSKVIEKLQKRFANRKGFFNRIEGRKKELETAEILMDVLKNYEPSEKLDEHLSTISKSRKLSNIYIKAQKFNLLAKKENLTPKL